MADALAKLRNRRAERFKAMPTARTCDGCNACCIALHMKVPEFTKIPGEPCRHLRDDPAGNCSIYERRPHACREFYCLWRMSDAWLPDWMAPKLSGVVISLNTLETWPAVVTVSPLPGRKEVWKDMWIATVIRTLAEQWNCMVAIGSSPWTQAVITPKGEILMADRYPWIRTETQVAAPTEHFGPDRRPLFQQMRESLFKWSMIPPPWSKTDG